VCSAGGVTVVLFEASKAAKQCRACGLYKAWGEISFTPFPVAAMQGLYDHYSMVALVASVPRKETIAIARGGGGVSSHSARAGLGRLSNMDFVVRKDEKIRHNVFKRSPLLDTSCHRLATALHLSRMCRASSVQLPRNCLATALQPPCNRLATALQQPCICLGTALQPPCNITAMQPFFNRLANVAQPPCNCSAVEALLRFLAMTTKIIPINYLRDQLT